MTTGKTGIEIQVALSTGQRTVGKLLQALHLEGLENMVADRMEALISIDGKQVVEPLYEGHFMEAAPGNHTVDFAVRHKAEGGEAPEQAYGTKHSDVVVEPGRVTVLVYTPKDGDGSTLELMGDIPAP